MSAQFEHKCFGCGREIRDFEEHIHVGLDEWSASQGKETFGLDDLLTFPFCSECIQPGGPFTPESHEMETA